MVGNGPIGIYWFQNFINTDKTVPIMLFEKPAPVAGAPQLSRHQVPWAD